MKVIKTADGSTTLYREDIDETYHSRHGAVQEAVHVFIETGLKKCTKTPIRIFEMGFGTGLNALITCLEAPKQQLTINYTGVEAFPVEMTEVEQLDYCQQLGAENLEAVFQHMHQLPWESPKTISEGFTLHKQQKDFKEITDANRYHLIYFDAFGARVQPELWTEEIFEIMHTSLQQGGVLVTYAAKGSVRRAMQAVGFTVERLPGPPGKREMLRAIKN